MVTDEFVEYSDVMDSPMEISEGVLYHFKNDLGVDESSRTYIVVETACGL